MAVSGEGVRRRHAWMRAAAPPRMNSFFSRSLSLLTSYVKACSVATCVTAKVDGVMKFVETFKFMQDTCDNTN